MTVLSLIGVATGGGGYTARLLHADPDPATTVAALRRLWQQTFHRDTETMAAVLLNHDWTALTTDDADRPDTVGPHITGVGWTALTASPAHAGRITDRHVDANLAYLYLLDPARQAVLVHEPTRSNRWLRHSIHHLDPVEDLFTPTDHDGEYQVCTVCGAVDEIDHVQVPSMLGYGHDTATTCRRCGSSVSTDPMFGAHIDRRPWPPLAGAEPRPPQVAGAAPATDDGAGHGGDRTGWDAVVATVAGASGAAGRSAADWYTQEAIGGRAHGDPATAAGRILDGILDGDPAILDAVPACDWPTAGDEATRAVFYADLADTLPPWRTLTDTQRNEVADAYRDGFVDAAIDHIVQACRTATGHAGPDLSHLRPDQIRVGGVGVFAGDWSSYPDQRGRRLPVGYVGTLIDTWNGWAVFDCTRQVAEAIVAEQQRLRQAERARLRGAGVTDTDLDHLVDEALCRLFFDGDAIVADDGPGGDPAAVTRILPDPDGRYVVMGWAWCWEAVDPESCDSIVGQIPAPGTQQRYVQLVHTTAVTVPNDRLRLAVRRYQPTAAGGPVFTATITVDGDAVGTAARAVAAGGIWLSFSADGVGIDAIRDYAAGCRHRRQPVDLERVLDALADEDYLNQAVAAAAQRHQTLLRLVDDDGYTRTLRHIGPPTGGPAMRALGRALTTSPVPPGGAWQLWRGRAWYTLPPTH